MGSVAVARSQVETKEKVPGIISDILIYPPYSLPISPHQVLGRVTEALKHIPPERLILAPDCGLGMLPPDIIRQKLAVMREVASQF